MCFLNFFIWIFVILMLYNWCICIVCDFCSLSFFFIWIFFKFWNNQDKWKNVINVKFTFLSHFWVKIWFVWPVAKLSHACSEARRWIPKMIDGNISCVLSNGRSDFKSELKCVHVYPALTTRPGCVFPFLPRNSPGLQAQWRVKISGSFLVSFCPSGW